MKSATKIGLFAIAYALGCGSSAATSTPSGDASDDLGATDAATTEAATSDVAGSDVATTDTSSNDGAYPSGPYGSNAGDVIASLDWQGYVVPDANVVANTTTFTMTSLAQLRLLPNKGYALVHVSDFY
jgi:hypothetical protein